MDDVYSVADDMDDDMDDDDGEEEEEAMTAMMIMMMMTMMLLMIVLLLVLAFLVPSSSFFVLCSGWSCWVVARVVVRACLCWSSLRGPTEIRALLLRQKYGKRFTNHVPLRQKYRKLVLSCAKVQENSAFWRQK